MTISHKNTKHRRSQVVYAAQLMIERYGPKAVVEARIRCGELTELKDQVAVDLWLDITSEIKRQLRPQ